MFERFQKTVMHYESRGGRTVEQIIYSQNLSILRISACAVILVSMYWMTADFMLESYDLVPLARAGVYSQFIASVYMLFLPNLAEKYTNRLVRNSYLIFYTVLIAGVSVLTLTRNQSIIASGEISPYIGVSISTFYLFILAFMPMPDLMDHLAVVIVMTIGLVAPDLFFRTSSYSLLSHILLCASFATVSFFFRDVRLKSAVNEIEAARLSDELFDYSVRDAMTRILNRRAMDQYLSYLKDRGDVHHVGIVFFDVDYFKKYNDYYGHVCGDEILQKLAQTAQTCFEHRTDGFVFRYGGEEFIGILENADEHEVAAMMCRIRDTVYDANFKREDVDIFDRVTVTVGGAVEEMPNKSGDYVIAADSQLYVGKNNYRNAAYFDGRRVG